MNCSICKEKISTHFLGKMIGTIIKKPVSSKQYPVCPNCQRLSKDELLGKL